VAGIAAIEKVISAKISEDLRVDQETQVRKPAFSTTTQPPYNHHTASTELTKDKSACSIKVAGERDGKSAQKLGQPQPFTAVFP
jgi:hypothetical protein